MRVRDAINDLVRCITEVVEREELGPAAAERIFAVRERLALRLSRKLNKYGMPEEAEAVMDLYKAAEEYVVCFHDDPGGREKRSARIDVLKRRVRRSLLEDDDVEGDLEKLMDDIRQWQWKATLDANGRIAFATGSGVDVPARGRIIQEVGAQVIEQATRAQRPYSDDVRPRDARNHPGGLVNIRDTGRVIVVGDLHGRYDNLEAILQNKGNLKSVIDGDAHLVFLGDAVHPPSSKQNTETDYEDSFAVMLLIMTLKAENPFNVHYILGNHDAAHAGGWPVGKGGTRQDRSFEGFIRRRVDPSVLERYQEFVLNCPAAVLAHAPNGALIIVHATLSDKLLNAQGLVNVFVRGRRTQAMRDLLWSRDFSPERIRGLAERVGAKFVIGGHTVPTEARAAKYGFTATAPLAFGQVDNVQIIVCAQADRFGYMDIDLTQPLPDDITALRAPDGSSACRALEASG